MNKISLTCLLLATHTMVVAQNIGIGTTTPHPAAALDVKATGKGILFPRLSTAQRDAIPNPPNGLHIFNINDRCLNYFDSLFQVWNSYCNNGEEVVTIAINQTVVGGIDFYNTYAKNFPNARKFSLLIETGVQVVSGGYGPFFSTPDIIPIAALNFSALPANTQYQVKVVNRGIIVGVGGAGGNGAKGTSGNPCIIEGVNGTKGGVAIYMSATNLQLVIENYGTISGGGGGGGGGGRSVNTQYGGGGGGGATSGQGGVGGGNTTSSIFGSCIVTSVAQSGNNGGVTLGGKGGAGAGGGGNGGSGGNLAQNGQNGSGTGAGAGGAAGLTVQGISGPSGIVINNRGSGVVLGVVQ